MSITSDTLVHEIWWHFLKWTDGRELLKIDQRIRKLQSLILASRPSKSRVEEEQVIQARESSLMDLVEGSTTLRKAGKSYIGLCPFHFEKTPSFHVYPDSNTYHCFGCQANGDVIKYVMIKNQLSFLEAVRLLNGAIA